MRLFRLMAFDLDDTLLDPTGKLTYRNISALKSAMELGVKIVLATGRMIESAEPFAKEIGVNAPMIVYNGAMVYDLANRKAVSNISIDRDTAKDICLMAEESGIYIQVYPGSGYMAEKYTQYTKMYEDSIKTPCVITGNPVSGEIKTDVVKMLVIGEPETTKGNIARFQEKFPNVSFMMSRPNYIEIVSKGVDKKFAMRETLKALGIDKTEAIAFGDGQNDISMLNECGLGFCMMNADISVREKCAMFAPSNAEDGCAQVIERLIDAQMLGG